ncbi:hypothetical protein I3760_09G172000 [Carya illinoinensis]|nr:hypothetical protein I3760_09G172000 [Carya illinoinensis]
MSQLLNIVQATFCLNKLRFYDGPKFLQQKSCSYLGNYAQLQKYQGLQVQLSLQGMVVVRVECLFRCKACLCSGEELDAFPHIQTLRKFPKEELDAKVVLVRFDSAILFREEQQSKLVSNALFTIKYLYESGAKVVLASDWCTKSNPKLIHAESAADFLSSILKCRVVPMCSISCHTPSKREGLEKADILLLENLSEFKEEVANCSKFAQLLSWGIDIFVNDSFSLSHKILASTVGVARFCHSCVAGFHFEESLCQLKKVAETRGNSYVALIGGGNLSQKAAALHFLASRCDGWVPVDLGPVSLDEINSLLTKCEKVLWIGPLKFSDSDQHTNGASPLTQMLDILCQRKCDLTVVGSMAQMKKSSSDSGFNMLVNASVVWEFLKGRKLPGVMALDRAYPFEINWNATYCDPTQPLVVDIGSGNGLFIMGMARKRTDLNFLGLEINEKLTRHCVASVQRSGIKNGYFIATNATSTFRSIVSSYPGDLVLVSIQCPNPDFNKPEHRWRMLQRTLVEAVVDLLTSDGKVFLQSDIEAVAIRMREQFLKYGKGKLSVVHDQGDTKSREGWLEENPFGVRSDWEQHVIYRGAPMYRLMLSKSTSIE